jgi:hypothetical protein
MPSINYNGLGKPALALPVAEMLRGQPGIALDFSDQRRALSTISGAEYLGPAAGLPELTFARASVASYIDAAGQIQFAASGQPRFTYDKETLAPLGFLAEAARTNALANPIWSGPTTPTSWGSYSPEGVSIVPSKFGPNVSARRFTAEGNRPRLHQAVTLAAGVTYTFSVEAERVVSALAAAHALFCGTAGVTLTYPACPANPAGGAASALTTGRFVMQAVSATTQAASFQLGAGTQHNLVGMVIDFSMPQLEAGGWPTSFIPGGARAADRLTLTLPFDAGEEGITIAAKGRMPRWINPSSSNLFSFGVPSLATRLSAFAYAASALGIGSGGTPAPFATTHYQVVAGGAPARVAISSATTGDYRMCINGGGIATRAGTAMPAGSTFLDIGGLLGPYAWGDAVESIAVWRGTPHSDATLQGLLS